MKEDIILGDAVVVRDRKCAFERVPSTHHRAFGGTGGLDFEISGVRSTMKRKGVFLGGHSRQM